MNQNYIRKLIPLAQRVRTTSHRIIGSGPGQMLERWSFTERQLAGCVMLLTKELLDREWGMGLMNDGGTTYYCTACGNEEYLGHKPDCIFVALHEVSGIGNVPQCTCKAGTGGHASWCPVSQRKSWT